MLRSKPFLFLLALWLVLAFVTIRGDVAGGEYGSAFLPATGLIIATLRQPLSLVGMIIVIYYGAEMFWREQRYRFASIVDATPVRGGAMLLSKWFAIVALIGIVIALGIVAGIVVQLAGGYTAIDPLAYLSLFWFGGVPLAIYAAAAVAIHAASPGKYAGLVLVLLFLIVTKNVDAIGLEHPLWQFAAAPDVPYSGMSGFGASAWPFARLMLYWGVAAAALITLAAPMWRHLGERFRLRYAARASRRTVAVLVALLAILGAVNWRATRAEGYVSSAALLDWRAEYERTYRATAAQPRPRIAGVTTAVDLFPADGRLHIAGDYALVNETGRPLAIVDVATPRGTRGTTLSMSGARLTRDDARFGMHRFTFAPPLPNGASATLHFDLTLVDRDAVTRNGSVVMSMSTFPSLGYRAASEISDPRERARRGLGAPSVPDAEDADVVTSEPSESQRVTYDATISTTADEVAVTSGALQRQWTSGNRRYFHYRIDVPVRSRFTIASARYAVAHRNAGGVDVSVAYDPRHSANVPAMLDAASRTLLYGNRELTPYPHRQLALVEVPSWWNFGGLAFPGVVLLSERRAFLVDARDANRPDLVARRVAHEVGHQWFGCELIAASRAGALTLTESLAKYVEIVILEQLHGRDAVRQLLAYEQDRYLAGRAREPQRERPLMTAGEQPYLYYSKGALVMSAIRDLIGERNVNAALRSLLARRGNPTTADLLADLRSVSNDAQYAQIRDWMTTTDHTPGVR